jgi:tRNA pseudouridine55 synthase
MKGVLPIYKPVGYTSHDIVAIVRKKLKIKEVGHIGTLDPFATGVLVVCLGEATRIISLIQKQDKIYKATILLGTITDTDDITGNIISKNVVGSLDERKIKKVLKCFVGNIKQVPPKYSAIHVKGKRLYEYARENVDVDIPIRNVNIYKINYNGYDDNLLSINVHCATGTYIRALARDIGEKIGCGAVLKTLERTDVGVFRLFDCVSVEDLDDKNVWEQKLVSLETIFSRIYDVPVTQNKLVFVRNGNFRFIDVAVLNDKLKDKEILKVTYGGKIVAILQYVDKKLKVIRVFREGNEWEKE